MTMRNTMRTTMMTNSCILSSFSAILPAAVFKGFISHASSLSPSSTPRFSFFLSPIRALKSMDFKGVSCFHPALSAVWLFLLNHSTAFGASADLLILMGLVFNRRTFKGSHFEVAALCHLVSTRISTTHWILLCSHEKKTLSLSTSPPTAAGECVV